MTYATVTPDDFRFDRGRPSRRNALPALAGASAFVLGGIIGACLLNLHHAAAPDVRGTPAAPFAPPPVAAASSPVEPAVAKPAASAPARAAPAAHAAAEPDAALLDPAFSLGVTPVPLAQSRPLGAAFVVAPPARPTRLATADAAAAMPAAAPPAASAAVPPPATTDASGPASPVMPATSPLVDAVPLPAPRPPEVWRPVTRPPFRTFARRGVGRMVAAAPAAGRPDDGNFLDKFFGMFKPTGPALGYAAPEDGAFGPARGIPMSPARSFDRWTAVYDISAHTVYLPSGARLEAHSGLGNRLDDPRYVSERNRGPTPPQVYDLEPREQLFHGVPALRLNPVGGGGVFGRTGLLAHTFMLGPNGDSNGCVSFRDYGAFLQAFRNGEIRRLAVVTRL